MTASRDRSARPVVAVLTPVPEAQLDLLRACADVVTADGVPALPAEVRRRCRAVILRSEATLSEAELAQLPELTDIVRPGSGTDNIAVTAAAARGVRLRRNAEVSAAAVAELAFAGLTVLCRRMGQGYRWLLENRFAKRQLLGESPAGLRTVVWGAGPVGRAVFHQWHAAGRQVAFAAHRSVPRDVPAVSPDEAFASADVHVLALPLRAATRRGVDDAWLVRVAEKRPYLLNVGRYELVDGAAVASALHDGRLRGCYVDPVDATQAADVADFIAATRDTNVFLTQHQGAQRADVRGELDAWAVQAAIDAITSGVS